MIGVRAASDAGSGSRTDAIFDSTYPKSWFAVASPQVVLRPVNAISMSSLRPIVAMHSEKQTQKKE
jgi:hypothetical protein